jgi:hypothetical protein
MPEQQKMQKQREDQKDQQEGRLSFFRQRRLLLLD